MAAAACQLGELTCAATLSIGSVQVRKEAPSITRPLPIASMTLPLNSVAVAAAPCSTVEPRVGARDARRIAALDGSDAVQRKQQLDSGAAPASPITCGVGSCLPVVSAWLLEPMTVVGQSVPLPSSITRPPCICPQMFLWPISGIPLSFVAAVLPLTMALPLASSRPVCRQLLEDSTSHAPLGTLHSLIGAAQ